MSNDKNQEPAPQALNGGDTDPGSLLDAAISNHQAGRLDLAEAGYRAVLDHDPDEPDALNLLGLILQDRKDYDSSIALITRALDIDPDFPEALTNLARAKRAVGDAEAAAQLAQRASELDPSLAEAHLLHGSALVDLAQYDKALAPLLAAVQLNPASMDAHAKLGNARMHTNDFTGAVSAFDAALAIDPRHTEALVNAGASLLSLGRASDALAYQQRAASNAPGDPVPHAAVASCLRQLGDVQGSADACLRAIKIAPDYHDALVLLGTNYTSLGAFAEAEQAFRQALTYHPESASARIGLAAMGLGGSDDDEIRTLKSVLHDATRPDFERVSAGFALGTILDREARYDEAFQAFAFANRQVWTKRQAEGRVFDPQMTHRHAAWARQTFTPELFAAAADLANPSEQPVFVVGMPRSGTTLVEQIAASHPQVFGAGELKAIPALMTALDGGSVHRSPLAWNREHAKSLAAAHLASLSEMAPGAVRVIDKLPDNIQALGQIAVLFPKARVVICRRDPRDTSLSCYFQHFGDGLDWTYDLTACGARAAYVEDLTEFWRTALPLNILEVEYEKLVADIEPESRRLIAFLGLEWNPACLDFHKSDRPVMTASHWQVRQPLYNTSVGRWRHYQAHIGPLLAALDTDAPETASSLASVARIHMLSEEFQEAVEAARRSIALDPEHREAHGMLGAGLIKLDRLGEAIEILEKAVRLSPERPDFWANLAAALSQTRQYPQAYPAWQQVLKLQPDNVEYVTAFAIVARELGRHDEAIALLRRAAQLDPENPLAQGNVASVLLGAMKAEEAEAFARKAVTLKPGEPEFHVKLGECLSALGRFDEAETSFRAALQLSPDSPRALLGLVGIGKMPNSKAGIATLRHIVADEIAPRNDRSNAGYALAKILERLGDYDGAFESCSTANEMAKDIVRDQGRVYDARSIQDFVDGIITRFGNRSGLGVASGNASEIPVFIVGMPRSGTTLVEQIIASHPDAFGLGETHTIGTAVNELGFRAAFQGGGRLPVQELNAKADAILADMRTGAPNAKRIADKMPGNLPFLGYIGMLFPQARVILCRRDPRDIGLSCFFENFTDGLEWSYDLTDIGLFMRQMERLVDLWRRVPPVRILEVEYETLVSDLEGQGRRLIDFLGLDWHPDCLSFHETKRTVVTASHWQVRQPLYSSSMGRWRKYERHLGPLLTALDGLVTSG